MPLLAASLLLSPSTARAESYDPAPISLSELYAKVDAAMGVRSSGLYRREWHTHWPGGDRVSIEYYWDRDFKWETTGGGFSRAGGSFNGQGWSQDENGIVTLKAGLAPASDPTDVALSTPSNSDNVHLLGLTHDAKPEYVVEAKAPKGADDYLYYDASTFLLDREVYWSRTGTKYVADFTDYHDVGGRKFPFTVHESDGHAQNDEVRQTISYAKTNEVVSFAIPQTRPLFSLFGSGPLVLPADFTDDGIVVRLTINGRGVDLLLDSGATGLTLDPGVLHDLGLTPYGNYSTFEPGGNVDVGQVRVPDVALGALHMNNVEFDSIPISDETERGHRIVGLFGSDFFASTVVGIDFKNKILEIVPRSAFDPSKLVGFLPVPIELEGGTPLVPVTTENVKGHFLVDTGAFAVIFEKRYIEKLPDAPILRNEDTVEYIGGIGGDIRTNERSVTDFTFAGTNFQHAKVVVPIDATALGTGYDGLIGRNALSVYTIFFDYQNHVLYAAPSN